MVKKRITLRDLQNAKGNEKIVMVTAYDALFASLFDPHVDAILVGDSLNMSFAGKVDTLSATMDQMIYHTQAVCQGAKESYIICDMPFGSYPNCDEALKNATRVYQETSADAVKLEGGKSKADIIRHLTQNEIAVFGHIGLKPQSARSEGGYHVKGKTTEEKKSLLEDALHIQEAGAVALVIEGVKSDIAHEITQSLKIPTIGIGAGVGTDGQVLVWSDMLGFFDKFVPKFVKQYMDGGMQVQEAMKQYAKEVKASSFPKTEHTY